MSTQSPPPSRHLLAADGVRNIGAALVVIHMLAFLTATAASGNVTPELLASLSADSLYGILAVISGPSVVQFGSSWRHTGRDWKQGTGTTTTPSEPPNA